MTKTGRTQRYAERGYLSGIPIFSDVESAKIRARFAEFEEREGKDRPQERNRNRHFELEWIWRVASDERILSVMREIMGSDILLIGTDFFCKYPGPEETKFIAWHQDVAYWGLKPPVAHTAWIAIDDSDAGNGCMRVIPESHLQGIVTHETSERHSNLLSINQEIPDELVDTEKAVDVVLKAGEISVHHGQMFHASTPNRSSRRRCGLTIRCVPPHVAQVEKNSLGTRWPAVLVSGEDKYGNFDLKPRPFSSA